MDIKYIFGNNHKYDKNKLVLYGKTIFSKNNTDDQNECEYNKNYDID